MRTVTFSSAGVTSLVNKNFVATWTNRNSEFHNCDGSEEQRIFTTATECYATPNICTFFLTPNLEVLHYTVGYYSPSRFLEEVGFLLETAKKVLDKEWRVRSLDQFIEMHQKHSQGHENLARATEAKWEELAAIGSIRARQALNLRLDNLFDGLGSLGKVHHTIARISYSRQRLPLLTELSCSYRQDAGNMFSEEHSTSTWSRIEKQRR